MVYTLLPDDACFARIPAGREGERCVSHRGDTTALSRSHDAFGLGLPQDKEIDRPEPRAKVMQGASPS